MCTEGLLAAGLCVPLTKGMWLSSSCQLPHLPRCPRVSRGFRFSECSCMLEKGWDSCKEERSTCVYVPEYLRDFPLESHKQEMIIAGLQPETAYSITVAAYTMKGDGARSKPKVVTTKGAGKSFPEPLGFHQFPKAKKFFLQTQLLSSHSLHEGQTCNKCRAAPKTKLFLVRQKPLHSSQVALTK